MLDAPVSGGTAGAAAGTLTFMVGGDAAVLERARPVLSAMGKNLFHAGPDGAGQVAKVCNNQLLAVQMIGTAEALALGVANGLDAATLAEIMRQSSGGNWVLEKYNPWPGVMENAPASKGYSGGFMSQLMAKDLGWLRRPPNSPPAARRWARWPCSCTACCSSRGMASWTSRRCRSCLSSNPVRRESHGLLGYCEVGLASLAGA